MEMRANHEVSAPTAEFSWHAPAMIQRTGHVRTILRRLRSFPVIVILGPRQIGKTTLAQQVAKAHRGAAHRPDLENPADLNRLM